MATDLSCRGRCSKESLEDHSSANFFDEEAFGGVTPGTPKFFSTADPTSDGPGSMAVFFFTYCTNCPIDLEHTLILDAQCVSPE